MPTIPEISRYGMCNSSLLPRLFFAGEEKTAWYNLFAHASNYQKSG